MLLLVCIEKKESIAFYLINNLDAARLIIKIKRSPSQGPKLKMDHFSQVGVLEVFVEAAPTTFLLVVMIVSGLNSHGEDGLEQLLMGNGWGRDLALFMISCGSSIFSFAFGVSRYEYDDFLRSIMSSSFYFLNEQSQTLSLSTVLSSITEKKGI